MGERFGISGGTTRVALSRMVDRGELTNDDGVYALAGELLERQERQDRSRNHARPTRWDGTWEQAVVTVSGLAPSDRNRVRRALSALGLGERREGVWMRPANLDPGRLPSAREVVDHHVDWYRIAPLEQAAAAALAARLFDLDGWAATAAQLQTAMRAALHGLDADDDAVVSGFTLASAALRHLVHDPQLPPELEPDHWPVAALRRSYDDYERAYQQLLRRFFRSIN
jgi:phenylacetic acid degradation operon negative regulatory protein